MIWEPDCENASGVAAAAQIIARSLSKFGCMEEEERCAALLLCLSATLHRCKYGVTLTVVL